MDAERVKRLARRILADVLSIGSTITGGPTLSAEQEGEVLDAIAARLSGLPHQAHESDDELAVRFRASHPELFRGNAHERHRAARAPKGQG